MRKKNFSKKLLSMALAGSLVVGMTSTLSGCGSKKNGTVTLDVYSMLANYSGIQSGWGADLLKQKFNVKLNYVQSDSGTFDTRMEILEILLFLATITTNMYRPSITKRYITGKKIIF